MAGRDRAVQTLQHYLRTAWEHAGLKWGLDNDVEVEDIVDSILDEAADTSREHVAELRQGTAEVIAAVSERVEQPDWRERR